MSAIIKSGGSDSQKIMEVARALEGLIDPKAIRSELLSAKDKDSINGNVQSIRQHLRSSLDKLEEVYSSSDYRSIALVKPANQDLKKHESRSLEKNNEIVTISFNDLKDLFEESKSNCTVEDKSLKLWRKLQKKKIPGWYKRIFTRGSLIPEGNFLDMFVDLSENVLRELPAYGDDFSIDRSKLVYTGNLQNLYALLKTGPRGIGVIVDVYPRNIPVGDLDDEVDHWLARQLEWNSYEGGINDSPAIKTRCGTPEIKLLFKLPGPKTEQERVNWSFEDQMKKWGARLPTMGELLFYGMGRGKCKKLPFLHKGSPYPNINNPGIYRINGQLSKISFRHGNDVFPKRIICEYNNSPLADPLVVV